MKAFWWSGTLWHRSFWPHKERKRKYWVPEKGVKYFQYPTPDSLVAQAAWDKSKQKRTCKITCQEKEPKRLDLLSYKVYLSASMQMMIANYQVVLSAYNFCFMGYIIQHHGHATQRVREGTKAYNGKNLTYSQDFLTKTSLDASDTTKRAKTMRYSSSFQGSSIP